MSQVVKDFLPVLQFLIKSKHCLALFCKYPPIELIQTVQEISHNLLNLPLEKAELALIKKIKKDLVTLSRKSKLDAKKILKVRGQKILKIVMPITLNHV